MGNDWTFALDMCASNGILDYDAAADLLDQKSRYLGNPKLSEIPEMNEYLQDNPKMKSSPNGDEFVKPAGDNLIQNPTWKKLLLGGIAALGIGGVVFTISKGKVKLPKISKPNFSNLKMPNLSNIKNSIVGFAKKIFSYLKKPFVAVANMFKNVKP